MATTDSDDVKIVQALRRRLGEAMTRDHARLRAALDRAEARVIAILRRPAELRSAAT